jgi:hypothetical protein
MNPKYVFRRGHVRYVRCPRSGLRIVWVNGHLTRVGGRPRPPATA